MSYSQIFRRISRLLQSSVNSVLSDTDKAEERAFDEELHRSQQKENQSDRREESSRSHREDERSKQERSAGGTTTGQRKPGERDDAYYLAVLGVTPSASNDEVRKAYRKLMGQYHPDRVATLGPELQKTAADKSKEINEAFMIIERRRGMK